MLVPWDTSELQHRFAQCYRSCSTRGSSATVTVAVTLPFVISHFSLYLNLTCAADLWSVALVIVEMSTAFFP